jgi:hypothetical protein
MPSVSANATGPSDPQAFRNVTTGPSDLSSKHIKSQQRSQQQSTGYHSSTGPSDLPTTHSPPEAPSDPPILAAIVVVPSSVSPPSLPCHSTLSWHIRWAEDVLHASPHSGCRSLHVARPLSLSSAGFAAPPTCDVRRALRVARHSGWWWWVLLVLFVPSHVGIRLHCALGTVKMKLVLSISISPSAFRLCAGF